MLSWSEILIRLVLASLFGAFIGLERERKDWAAGLRTHMLVCVGSCLIMIVSAFGFFDILDKEHISLDPSRIAAQVVSGIGFIGAGTILFLKQGTIRGLTTASGLWTVAAIGLATGGGLYFAACITTIIALIILWALQPIERLYSKRFKQRTLKIVINNKSDDIDFMKQLHANSKIKIRSFSFEKKEFNSIILLKIENTDNNDLIDILNQLKNENAVKEFQWV